MILCERREDKIFVLGTDQEYTENHGYLVNDGDLYEFWNNRAYFTLSKCQIGNKEPIINRYYYPVVDFYTMATVINFLRAVYKEHFGEGNVCLALRRDQPLTTQKYRIIVPKQTVSGSTVEYKMEDVWSQLRPNEMLAGTIHSHPGFSAFASGTDTNDEANSDGLHITVGQINRSQPEFHSRVRCAVNVFDVANRIELLPANVIRPIKDQIKKLGIDGTKIIAAIYESYNWGFPTDIEFPKEWLEKVEKKTWHQANYQNEKYGNRNYMVGGEIGFEKSSGNHLSNTKQDQSIIGLIEQKEEDWQKGWMNTSMEELSGMYD